MSYSDRPLADPPFVLNSCIEHIFLATFVTDYVTVEQHQSALAVKGHPSVKETNEKAFL